MSKKRSTGGAARPARASSPAARLKAAGDQEKAAGKSQKRPGLKGGGAHAPGAPAAFRKEKDTLGEILVPQDKLYGAQTQRSLENFPIGRDLMPFPLISAIALVKEAAAAGSRKLGLMSAAKARLIEKAAREIQEGRVNDSHFPLSVWQTGSGTQTNMNVNEVIARRAGQLSQNKISFHPNDDVNLSQSSNDVFPSAMRIAALKEAKRKLLPAIALFEKELQNKERAFQSIVKIGRTHLMDATPLTLGQEFSAFREQIRLSGRHLSYALRRLLLLPLGGTAVGTGLNTAPGFRDEALKAIARLTGEKFVKGNPFESQASEDAFVQLSGALKGLAASLMKIGNDLRLLASGPRTGLGELQLPANEPGSSIMPGKINPTQCEALTMVCAQVIGQDLAITMGGAGGQLQLNAFKPLIIFNTLRSIELLKDSLNVFRVKCLAGIQPRKERIKEHVSRSLMLVTALNPYIGYEKSAQIAKKAFLENISLKQAAERLNILSPSRFDQIVQPLQMTAPRARGQGRALKGLKAPGGRGGGR